MDDPLKEMALVQEAAEDVFQRNAQAFPSQVRTDKHAILTAINQYEAAVKMYCLRHHTRDIRKTLDESFADCVGCREDRELIAKMRERRR